MESKIGKSFSSHLKNNLKFECFEIINQISHGSFGDVFLATNSYTPNHLYAIKTIHLRPKDSDSDILKEIETLENLDASGLKPNSIPKYYGYAKESNKFNQTQYHLVFEYFPKTLKSVLENIISKGKKKSGLPFETLNSYFDSLVNALAYMQAKEICHRDLKPANIMLDNQEDNIFLIDYGASQSVFGLNPNETKKKMELAGSPLYFSPELIECFNKKEEDSLINPFKSDVFSFGLVVLEMGILKLPEKHKSTGKWKSKSIADCLDLFETKYLQLLEGRIQKRSLRYMIGILRECLSIDPNDRPDFIEIFKTKLEKVRNREKIILHILVEDMSLTIDNIQNYQGAKAGSIFYSWFSTF